MAYGLSTAITAKLNTQQAEKDLKKLEKQAEATAGRIGDKGGGTGGVGGRGRIGGGLRGALGTGFGIAKRGYSLGRRAAGALGAFGSIGDITSEGLAGISAGFDAWMGAPEARWTRAAREDTAHKFAEYWSAVGKDAYPEVKSHFDQAIKHTYKPMIQGQSDINQALGGPQGNTPDLKGPLDRMTDAIVGEIKTGFDRVENAVGGGGTKTGSMPSPY